MSEREKTAPYTSVGADDEQSLTNNSNIIAQNPPKVKWLSDEKKIDEPLFCKMFCNKRELRCIGGKFFSVDGEENDDSITAQISELLSSNGITSGLAKKTEALFKALKLHCHSKPIKPCEREIHVLNGVISVDGEIGEQPTFIQEKRFCTNRLNVEYDPDIWKRCYYPVHFMKFLCQLLDVKDGSTVLPLYSSRTAARTAFAL